MSARFQTLVIVSIVFAASMAGAADNRVLALDGVNDSVVYRTPVRSPSRTGMTSA